MGLLGGRARGAASAAPLPRVANPSELAPAVFLLDAGPGGLETSLDTRGGQPGMNEGAFQLYPQRWVPPSGAAVEPRRLSGTP